MMSHVFDFIIHSLLERARERQTDRFIDVWKRNSIITPAISCILLGRKDMSKNYTYTVLASKGRQSLKIHSQTDSRAQA